MRRNKKTKRSWWRRRSVVVPAVVVIAAAVAVSGVALWQHHRNEKPVVSPTADSNTKGETSSGSSSNSSSGQSSSSSSSSSNGTSTKGSTSSGSSGSSSPAANSAPLLAPSGTFVSDHHPNLSGKPAPNTIQSTCNTTPGATCQIIFTSGSTTKTLAAQTTDSGGATYWTWKLQDVGLTAGTWHIQAKATLGSQTQTADDALTLDVSQ